MWYVGRFHFAITIARLRGDARVYVSADTDTRTFAQIEFERIRTRRGSAIRASTYDLFQGEHAWVVHGDSVQISFHNYLQDRGVRPGAVPVRLHVEQFGGARVERVVVYKDSAIETTRRPPTPLAIQLAPLDAQPTVGESFRVRVTLATKAAGDVLRNVSIVPQYDRDRLRLVEPLRPRRWRSLQGSTVETFVFEALRSGRQQIGFAAASNINSPRAALLVDVADREKGLLGRAQLWIGAAFLLLGLALVGWVIAHRHRPRSAPVER